MWEQVTCAICQYQEHQTNKIMRHIDRRTDGTPRRAARYGDDALKPRKANKSQGAAKVTLAFLGSAKRCGVNGLARRAAAKANESQEKPRFA
jgi:hypothetical protein